MASLRIGSAQISNQSKIFAYEQHLSLKSWQIQQNFCTELPREETVEGMGKGLWQHLWQYRPPLGPDPEEQHLKSPQHSPEQGMRGRGKNCSWAECSPSSLALITTVWMQNCRYLVLPALRLLQVGQLGFDWQPEAATFPVPWNRIQPILYYSLISHFVIFFCPDETLNFVRDFSF